jgi:hypothetical protein
MYRIIQHRKSRTHIGARSEIELRNQMFELSKVACVLDSASAASGKTKHQRLTS